MRKWLGHHDVGNIYAIDDSFLEAGGGIPQSSLRSEGGRHVTGDNMNVRNLRASLKIQKYVRGVYGEHYHRG